MLTPEQIASLLSAEQHARPATENEIQLLQQFFQETEIQQSCITNVQVTAETKDTISLSFMTEHKKQHHSLSDTYFATVPKLKR